MRVYDSFVCVGGLAQLDNTLQMLAVQYSNLKRHVNEVLND